MGAQGALNTQFESLEATASVQYDNFPSHWTARIRQAIRQFGPFFGTFRLLSESG